MVVIDLDSFKQINNTFGHAMSDEVLRPRRVAAEAVLERLQDVMSGITFTSEAKVCKVSFSAGLVQLQPGERIEAAIRRADALFYIAKAVSCNRIMSERTRHGLQQDEA